MKQPKQVKLRIQRFDPEKDSEPHYDTFNVSVKPRMTVLDALFQVLEEKDPSLTLRYSCRSAVCGSCAMTINGQPRLACRTQIITVGPTVTVAPLQHLPVVRDLIVDLHPFYDKINMIKPHFEPREAYPQREFTQTVKDREALDFAIDCIECGNCFSSCPLTWTDPNYPGPAALLRAYRFIADTRDGERVERLRTVGCEDGVWRCHTVFNCADACPKALNPTYFIQQLKRKATRLSIGLR